MTDTSATSSIDGDAATVPGPFAVARDSLSVTRLGAAWAATLVSYFAFVVPDEVAVLLVGSAFGFVFASYAPLVGILVIGRLVG